MFDIGFLELIVIGIVGLVVIGPERLPKVASTLGRWVGRSRQYISNVKRDIDREMRQEELREALKRDASLDEIKGIINDSKYIIEDEENTISQPVVRAIDDEADTSAHKDGFDDFENAQYGLTDHADYGPEEYEREQAALKQRSDTAKDEHDGKASS